MLDSQLEGITAPGSRRGSRPGRPAAVESLSHPTRLHRATAASPMCRPPPHGWSEPESPSTPQARVIRGTRYVASRRKSRPRPGRSFAPAHRGFRGQLPRRDRPMRRTCPVRDCRSMVAPPHRTESGPRTALTEALSFGALRAVPGPLPGRQVSLVHGAPSCRLFLDRFALGVVVRTDPGRDVTVRNPSWHLGRRRVAASRSGRIQHVGTSDRITAGRLLRGVPA